MKKIFTYKQSTFGNEHILYMYLNGQYVGCSQWKFSNVYDVISKFRWIIEDERLYGNDDMIYIDQFYITEDFRGQGHSHKLIRETLSRIRKVQRNSHICLIAEHYSGSKFKQKPLYRLYQKHKFQRYRNSKYMFIYKHRYSRKKQVA